MNMHQLLAELAEQGIKLWTEGEQLRVRAPKGALTPQLRDSLAVHKAEVMRLLNGNVTQSVNAAPPIAKVSRSHPLPLSFAQERLWFLNQFDPHNPAYNECLTLRLAGNLNVAALEQSFNRIIQRHEILRTNFATVDGQPIQVIAERLQLTLPLADLSQLPAGEQETACHQHILAQMQRPFDLAHDPLLQPTLFKLNAADHILLITVHHIVWDGRSADDVFLRELAAFYSSVCQNSSLELPALPIQYADFAVWQRQQCATNRLDAQMNYWQQQLQDGPALLDLPTDRSRGITQTFQGGQQTIVFSPELTQALATFSQQRGVTLFMTLLAAFHVLLYRHTGQPDICIGIPITNRDRPELEGMIGFFINMLVLRADLSGNPRFEEVLLQIRERALAAYDHQDVPFEQLVEELRPERDLSYTPLFQVGFALYAATAPIQMDGLTVSPIASETGSAKFDLTLSLQHTSAGLTGQWQYKTALFDQSTIARISDHFQILLEGILQRPDQPIALLPIMSAIEQQQVLVDWNCTQRIYPDQICIHQLFEEQVERTPDRVAVRFADQQLTYRQLNTKANQVARYIQQLGVGPEVLVGICVERSLEMAIGLLSILKAGGAYLPLDPHYPRERLDYMLSDAHLSVLLTKSAFVGSLPTCDAKVVCLDTDQPHFELQSQENPTSQLKPNNLAYVIYTSGSTGKPKGVMIEHRSLVNFVQAAITEHDIRVGDQVLQFASINFDAAAEEIFSCLTTGGTLVLRTEEMLHSTATFVQTCTEWQLNVLFLPTAYWQQLIADLVAFNQSLPESVRIINIGGERLLPEKFKLWQKYVDTLLRDQQWATPPRLIHGYGPTEATVVTTFCDLTELGVVDGQREMPIGRPIANVQTYLLDQYYQPVPIGVPGELYIGGDGLARGYLNHPDLTAEKFIPNPFSANPTPHHDSGRANRLYKTGDLARFLPNGQLEFLGRIDHQVKIRGFRIEFGEIESALLQHPDVQEALVITQENSIGYSHLIAYVIASNQSKLQTQLRHFLKQKLPDYMIPSRFVSLDQFPMLPNGKVDRRALPLPDEQETLQPIDEVVSPCTPAEQILTDIWSDLLRRKQVSIHDNFFELGGDSIISIQIIARANQAGLQLTPKQLFQYQTIAELAAAAGVENCCQAEQGLISGEIPLTPIQQWFFEQAFVEPNHFNQSMLFLVPANLRPDVLKQALQNVLLHHDALRICFSQDNLRWHQINLDAQEAIPFEVIDLSKVPTHQQAAAIEQFTAQLQTTLDFTKAQVIRVALLKLGSGIDRLCIVIHHLVVDGVSWRILIEDLSTSYQQLWHGQPVLLPAKTISYQEWAIHLQNYGDRGAVTAESPHWLAQYPSGIDTLPLDIPGKEPNTEASVETVTTYLSAEETQALLEVIPAAYNSMINDILLTALAQTLTQWTGDRSLFINLEGHGREELFENVDVSRTVGWFTTVFPVLLKLDQAHDDPQTALQSIKSQLRAIPNQGIGYGILRYLSQDSEIRQQLQALPVAKVSFNYLGQFEQMFSESIVLGFAPENVGPTFSPLANRAHLLDVVGLVADGQLQMIWMYSRNRHHRSTVEHLASQYTRALKTLIEHGQVKTVGRYATLEDHQANLRQKNKPVSWSLPLHLVKLPDDITRLLPDDMEDAYPIARMQELMVHQYTKAPPGTGIYHCQQSFHIHDDSLEIIPFKRSLETLVRIHQTLRTGFSTDNGLLIAQVVRQDLRFSINEIDISQLTLEEQENYIDQLLEQDRQQVFQVTNLDEPLFRFWLLKKSPHTIEFFMSFHHAIIDGWSSNELINQLSDLYSSFKKGAEVEEILNPPTLNTYKEFVALEKEISVSKDASAFWKTHLQEYTYQPPQARMISGSASDSARVEASIDSDVILTLKQICQKLKVSTKATFLSIFFDAIVAQYENQMVCLGVVSNGRTERLSDPFHSLGLFWNIIPLCQNVIDDKILQIQNVQRSLIEIDPYSRYPLLQILSDQKKTALFFATFNMVNFRHAKPTQSRADLTIRESRSHDKFHFLINCTVQINSCKEIANIWIDYDPSYFSHRLISSISQDYIQRLKRIKWLE